MFVNKRSFNQEENSKRKLEEVVVCRVSDSVGKRKKSRALPAVRAVRRCLRFKSTAMKNQEGIEVLARSLNISSKRKVLFVTGAGLSVASGIPCWRTAENAVWQNYAKGTFTKTRFQQDPEAFLSYFSQALDISSLGLKKPNAAHEAIAFLAKLYGDRIRVITQNVDDLHREVPEDNLIKIHGCLKTSKCFTESCEYSRTNLHKVGAKVFDIQRCPGCNEIMCPNCLLFDEDYDDHDSYQFEKAIDWIDEADDIVFVGTSFSVSITNIIFDLARNHYENNEDVFIKRQTDLLEGNFVREKRFFNFNVENNLPLNQTSKIQSFFISGKCEETLPRLFTS
eukprot:augustus_masked-scaffold_38-processed-gene-0.44-mRNA-1 protein AED:1.00 eAED:1.00 QI:0/-1/0/0/-1/1/1/0/337